MLSGPNRKSPNTTTRPAATNSMATAKMLTLITIDRCDGILDGHQKSSRSAKAPWNKNCSVEGASNCSSVNGS